ncbi:hypothetical protein EYF80_027299 [Liparis tanakae]|uniref:Uncharacterized protein n=1 Tax=Liparis tanakae TaxID=230148 RepID=A0A4Z2H9Q0_9TELE|nr:hypothetical protein EYF80_027299 [Liparis tanakae]
MYDFVRPVRAIGRPTDPIISHGRTTSKRKSEGRLKRASKKNRTSAGRVNEDGPFGGGANAEIPNSSRRDQYSGGLAPAAAATSCCWLLLPMQTHAAASLPQLTPVQEENIHLPVHAITTAARLGLCSCDRVRAPAPCPPCSIGASANPSAAAKAYSRCRLLAAPTSVPTVSTVPQLTPVLVAASVQRPI